MQWLVLLMNLKTTRGRHYQNYPFITVSCENVAQITVRNYNQFRTPLVKIMKRIPKFASRGNKPFKTTFENLLDALIWFHLQEHVSGRHLVQSLQEDTFARDHIAPKEGMAKSTFFEAITERGVEPFQMVFDALQQEACSMLPRQYTDHDSGKTLLANIQDEVCGK